MHIVILYGEAIGTMKKLISIKKKRYMQGDACQSREIIKCIILILLQFIIFLIEYWINVYNKKTYPLNYYEQLAKTLALC